MLIKTRLYISRSRIIAMLLFACAGLLFTCVEAECRGTRTIDSLESSLKSASPYDKGTIYLNLAENYSAFNYDKTVEYFRLAINAYKETKQQVNVINAYMKSGAYFMSSGDYESAMEDIEKGITYAKKIDNKVHLVHGYSILSAIYRQTGRYNDGLKTISTIYKDYSFEKVSADLELMKKQKRKPTKDDSTLYYNIALLYNNCASIYQEIELNDEAIKMYHRAEFVAHHINSFGMQYRTYNNLVTLFSSENKSDSIDYYLVSLNKLFTNVNTDLKHGAIRRLRASLLFHKKRYKETLEVYGDNILDTKLVSFMAHYNDLMMIAECCKELHYWSRLKKTLAALEPSISKVGIIDQIPFYKCKVEYYKACNNPEYAILYSDTLLQLRERVLSTANDAKLVSQIANIQFQDRTNNQKFLKDKKLLLQKKSANRKKLLICSCSLVIVLFIAFFGFTRNSRLNKRIIKSFNDRNDELKKTNAEVDISNATRDKLCSIITDDVKNPMGDFNNVIGKLSERFSTLSKEEISEYINALKKSSDNSYQLLDNLLDWSKARNNTMKIEPEYLKTFEVVDQVISTQEDSAQAKNIELVNSVDPALLVWGDLYMFQKIIRILISNSVKFTRPGGRVEIGSHTGEQPEHVVIYIKDNGIGMSAEQMSKIFRFETNVSTPGTSEEKGTGLGLVLCKEFVSRNGAEITVSSAIEKGTQFDVIFRKCKIMPPEFKKL